MRLSLKSTGVDVLSATKKRGKLLTLLLAGALAPLLASCNSGAYPVDFLPEMHYQQTTRVQEPARFYPPAGSVPITGKGAGYTQQELATLRNPVSRDARSQEQGQRLFTVNCAPCHGPQGKGDGALKGYFEKAGQRPPPDLTQTTTAPSLFLSDGQVYGIITNGQGRAPERYAGLTNMPNFSNLLTDEERWTLVNYLRAISNTPSR